MPSFVFECTRAVTFRHLLVLFVSVLGSSCGVTRHAAPVTPDTPEDPSREGPARGEPLADGGPAAAPPPYFTQLVERARRRAAAPFTAPPALAADSALGQMAYDTHRRIRFRPEASLFRGGAGRFEAQFFHLGSTSRTPVDILVVEADTATPHPYAPDSFAFDAHALPAEFHATHYAGFRLHAPINTEAYRDEVIVFQGASYFRAVARGQAYGLSARGLAIDTGTAHAEEFPIFDAFYLVEPAASDEFAWVLATLSSPRATGAYAFRIHPGVETEVEVTAHVFLREGVEVLGFAPITSMFLFGEEGPARGGDFRPEVHDSDVLLSLAANGEQLVRPLRNPERTTVSTLRLDSPRGFGLLQRDRAFAHYQDLEACYHERPAVWVEPLDDWGPGAVRLLEIATRLETDDNIAAMWVPDQVPAGGVVLRYRLSFRDDVVLGNGARVTDTRIAQLGDGRARFIVEFVGAALEGRQDIRVDVTTDGGRVVEAHTEPNPYTGGVRASFEVSAGSPDVQLRAFLRSDADALSETWSYLWQPTR
jgi:glucans biosynthesis protein